MKSLRYLKGITILFLLTNGIFADAPNWDCDGDGVLDNYTAYQNNGSVIYCSGYEWSINWF